MRRSALALVAIIAAFGLAAPLFAQDVSAHPRVTEALAVIDRWIEGQRAYDAIPGVSAAVVYDQDVLWADGYGMANRAVGIPATPETVYSVCSISKLFTSIGVMQLRDAGHVRLDDRVGEHLDWFADLADTYPDAPPVTVQGILTHSAGLPRESDFPYWRAPFPFPTREQMMDRLSEQEELYPAFERHQYSNLGLSLAGEIISATTGVDYHDYMRGHVLDPLGMSSTYSEIPADEHGKKMAIGYSAPGRDGSRAEVALFAARGIAPAAGYASTVLDLARFASWQFRTLHGDAGSSPAGGNGDRGDGHGSGGEILAKNTLAEMHRVHWLNPDWELKWGLGFATWRADDRTYVGHGGGCPGFITHFSVEPDGKIATVFLSNANGTASSTFTRRMHEIVGPAIRAAVADAEKASRETEDNPAFEGTLYTGTYDGAPWGGETVVVEWEGGLGAMSLPTMNPMASMARLKHVDGHTFRRVQADGELAEEWRFEIGEDGRASRYWVHSNFSPRVTGSQ